jgi:hypothetical protein
MYFIVFLAFYNFPYLSSSLVHIVLHGKIAPRILWLASAKFDKCVIVIRFHSKTITYEL